MRVTCETRLQGGGVDIGPFHLYICLVFAQIGPRTIRHRRVGCMRDNGE